MRDFMGPFKKPVQIIGDSAQDLYKKLLQEISQGENVESVKAKNTIGSFWGTKERKTKELRYANMILTNPRHRIINAPVIRQNKIIARTVLTTLSDEQNVDALQFYDPRAQEFSDDGKVVSTNYGYRIRHLNNTDQILQVIDQFKKDPNTRRAVIHIHTVSDYERKYTPCIDSIHFLIRNGKLECQTFWRSENALTLFPVNLFEFTMFQELICSELNLSPGPYIHTVSSLHYYLDDQERFEATLKFLNTCEEPTSMSTMSENSLKQIAILREYEKKFG